MIRASGWVRSLDRPLVAIWLSIVVLGAYNLSSASQPLGYSLMTHHILHVGVGLLATLAVSIIPPRLWRSLCFIIFAASLALLLLTSAFGVVVKGSRRWLELGPIRLQTSDVAKLAVVLVMARVLSGEPKEGAGGWTLRSLLRPMNLSRPIFVVLAAVFLLVLGPSLFPPSLHATKHNGRTHAVLRLRPNQDHWAIPTAGAASPESATNADIRLRAHVIRAEDGALMAASGTDVGQGLWINGSPVFSPVALAHGMVVRVGARAKPMVYRARFERWGFLLWPVLLVGLVWLLAAILRHWGRASTETGLSLWVAPADFVLIPFGFILVQPDLGTALVLGLVAFTMTVQAGLSWRSLALVVAQGLMVVLGGWRWLLKPYQKDRVRAFLDPSIDPGGIGYHQQQALIAIGSGRAWGKGHGQGTQTQLSFLPEQQTDFVFPVWAEEHGFVGALVVVALFAALVVAGLRVAVRARDAFEALLAGGAVALIFWHAAINLMMVLRLAPVVGVPLPFWSHGGSFILVASVAVGLLVGLSTRQRMFG